MGGSKRKTQEQEGQKVKRVKHNKTVKFDKEQAEIIENSSEYKILSSLARDKDQASILITRKNIENFIAALDHLRTKFSTNAMLKVELKIAASLIASGQLKLAQEFFSGSKPILSMHPQIAFEMRHALLLEAAKQKHSSPWLTWLLEKEKLWARTYLGGIDPLLVALEHGNLMAAERFLEYWQIDIRIDGNPGTITRSLNLSDILQHKNIRLFEIAMEVADKSNLSLSSDIADFFYNAMKTGNDLSFAEEVLEVYLAGDSKYLDEIVVKTMMRASEEQDRELSADLAEKLMERFDISHTDPAFIKRRVIGDAAIWNGNVAILQLLFGQSPPEDYLEYSTELHDRRYVLSGVDKQSEQLMELMRANEVQISPAIYKAVITAKTGDNPLGYLINCSSSLQEFQKLVNFLQIEEELDRFLAKQGNLSEVICLRLSPYPEELLEYLCAALKEADRNTLLHNAVRSNNESVVKILLSKGVDVNAKDEQGVTALQMASTVSMLDLLLSSGRADNNVKDSRGYTLIEMFLLNNPLLTNLKEIKGLIEKHKLPLSLQAEYLYDACKKDSRVAVAIWLDYGGMDGRWKSLSADDEGNTVYHLALDVNIVKVLFKAGVFYNPDHQNKDGETVFERWLNRYMAPLIKEGAIFKWDDNDRQYNAEKIISCLLWHIEHGASINQETGNKLFSSALSMQHMALLHTLLKLPLQHKLDKQFLRSVKGASSPLLRALSNNLIVVALSLLFQEKFCNEMQVYEGDNYISAIAKQGDILLLEAAKAAGRVSAQDLWSPELFPKPYTFTKAVNFWLLQNGEAIKPLQTNVNVLQSLEEQLIRKQCMYLMDLFCREVKRAMPQFMMRKSYAPIIISMLEAGSILKSPLAHILLKHHLGEEIIFGVFQTLLAPHLGYEASYQKSQQTLNDWVTKIETSRNKEIRKEDVQNSFKITPQERLEYYLKREAAIKGMIRFYLTEESEKQAYEKMLEDTKTVIDQEVNQYRANADREANAKRLSRKHWDKFSIILAGYMQRFLDPDQEEVDKTLLGFIENAEKHSSGQKRDKQKLPETIAAFMMSEVDGLLVRMVRKSLKEPEKQKRFFAALTDSNEDHITLTFKDNQLVGWNAPVKGIFYDYLSHLAKAMAEREKDAATWKFIDYIRYYPERKDEQPLIPEGVKSFGRFLCASKGKKLPILDNQHMAVILSSLLPFTKNAIKEILDKWQAFWKEKDEGKPEDNKEQKAPNILEMLHELCRSYETGTPPRSAVKNQLIDYAEGHAARIRKSQQQPKSTAMEI